MLVLVALTYAAWIAAAWGFQRWLVFPRWVIPGAVRPAPPGAEVLRRVRPDGVAVEAWFFPVPRDGPAPVVVFLHGNAERIADCLDLVELYRALGIGVLLPEYRGYGVSGGTPSQHAVTADLVAFVDELRARADVDPHRVVYHGRSLGGGMACALAAERAPGALVLESTFTSIRAFAWGVGLPPFVCRDPFASDRTLPALRCPVLILHGTEDEIVPVAHARRLHALAPAARLELWPGGHNDFPRDPALYARTIGEFLAPLLAPPAPAVAAP